MIWFYFSIQKYNIQRFRFFHLHQMSWTEFAKEFVYLICLLLKILLGRKTQSQKVFLIVWVELHCSKQPSWDRFLFFLALHDKVGSVKAPPIIVDLLSKVFPLPYIKAKSNLSIFLDMPTYVHQRHRHQVAKYYKQ